MAISKAQILFFFLCDMMLTRVASLPTGAPSRACSDMLPRHSGTRPQSAQTSPFSLSQPTAYFPGQASSFLSYPMIHPEQSVGSCSKQDVLEMVPPMAPTPL
ncbi:hypothetical protein HOLleu_10291 [Holothuria leucospilota]|uniref:Uncharacterized protein n=1 Tax=Holothuria leucospilota TaxID=206669 RepID=A0A9Q1CEJ3_HOLLE|nr:hypothetical protein HOLleu_10291 [Holothuria leucospilota]